MPFLETARNLDEVYARCIGASLVTIDAENVLTRYGDPEIRTDGQNLITRLINLPSSPSVAVATNNKDRDYVRELGDQLPVQVHLFSGIDYPSKKTSPGMFLAAAKIFDIDPREGIHVDDQWLSFRGARQAGYSTGILVRPWGKTDHNGVKVGRVLDVSAWRLTRFREFGRDVLNIGDHLSG